ASSQLFKHSTTDKTRVHLAALPNLVVWRDIAHRENAGESPASDEREVIVVRPPQCLGGHPRSPVFSLKQNRAERVLLGYLFVPLRLDPGLESQQRRVPLQSRSHKPMMHKTARGPFSNAGAGQLPHVACRRRERRALASEAQDVVTQEEIS